MEWTARHGAPAQLQGIEHLDTSVRVWGHHSNSTQYTCKYAPLSGISNFRGSQYAYQHDKHWGVY